MKKNKVSGKEAKFFCESCGSEVPRQSKFCPTCGKFFMSVRCPNCGKIGTNDDFKNGCPDCGYAVDKTAAAVTARQFENIKNYSYSQGIDFNGKKSSRAAAMKKNDSQLPIWIPIVCICVLGALIAGLYSCL